MDKRIFRLVIITIVLIMIICLIVIYALVNMEYKDSEAVTPPITTEELKAVPIDDPIGEDGMKIHTSENGYTVKYPGDMTAKSMAKSVDFILEDDESGSSLNIVTAKNDGTFSGLSKEELAHSLEHSSENYELISYEEITLNGADAVVAEYIYINVPLKQIVVVCEEYAYNITVMKSAYISDEMSEIFDNVVNSFTLN